MQLPNQQAKIIFSVICFTVLFMVLKAQPTVQNSSETHRFMFYNVENYFDPFVDSLSSYNEFVPDGMRHWTYSRYIDKRNKIYKVITGLGGWQYPTIVAFAEIENRFVLEDLIASTPLKNAGYEIIHFESKDERGIDVGMIYLADHFKPLHAQIIPIIFENDTADKTRDILYVKGYLGSNSLHLFINHWPSRYGGLMASSPLRLTASKTLIRVCDSVCISDANAKVLIMGDFNDDRENESLKLLEDGSVCGLQILQMESKNKDVKGTLKYQGNWDVFDNIIVSGALLNSNSGLSLAGNSGHVFDAPFLLESDERHLGVKPFRTYTGYKYNEGFSDHLPVFVDIYTHKSK